MIKFRLEFEIIFPNAYENHRAPYPDVMLSHGSAGTPGATALATQQLNSDLVSSLQYITQRDRRFPTGVPAARE